MKKIYILTCVNENCDIVSVNPYKSEDEARAAMKAEYEAEARDAEANGYELDDYFSGVERNTAGISYGDECEYKWQIHEIEVPQSEDDADRSLKEQFVEQVYFELKSDVENGLNCTLTEPENGYATFYLDEGNETIMVNNPKNGRTDSIFNIDLDTAYEVAKQIHNGDYDV